MMENTAAVFTGAEQQYMTSWSQQKRIRCLFKIWGRRGRARLAPVVIFKREGEALVWGKWAPGGWSPLAVKIAAMLRLLEDTRGLWSLTRGGIVGQSHKSEFCLWDPWAITLIGQMRNPKPDEVSLLKVNNDHALVNKLDAAHPLHTARPLHTAVVTLTHTPSLSNSEAWPTWLKSGISLRRVL